MSCREYADLLSLHAGGDLEREDDARVRQHVNGCTECARELEDYRLSLSALKELDRDEPVASLWPELRSRIDPNVVPFRVPAWALCAAALLVGLSVGLVINELSVERPDPAPVTVTPERPAVEADPIDGTPVGAGGWRDRPRRDGDERRFDRRFHLQRVMPPQSQDVRRISF